MQLLKRKLIDYWRVMHTVKYEDVYLRGYASLGELTEGLTGYFQF